MKLAKKDIGEFHVSCDIGCHLFSILPPFDIGNTTMGYGLGWAGASALNAVRASASTPLFEFLHIQTFYPTSGSGRKQWLR